MHIWRIAGFALLVGVALFLVTLLLKLLLVASVAFLLVRAVAGRLMGRRFGNLRHGGWQSAEIISIDNPAYRNPMPMKRYDRVIPIS
ncbi:hypothetical protein WBJ53_26640 [Spirosoma sp. SC4-14]|uniref:hypothetical protein n=1 Tax=Spirosoma sp. SC4-14 TaxID=3128900 RepID=UPI0030D3A6C7